MSDWVMLRENRAARDAVERVLRDFTEHPGERVKRSNPPRALNKINKINPLFLHGPAGTGKSLLVSFLIREVTSRAPARQVCLLTGNELLFTSSEAFAPETIEQRRSARQADLLLVEDLQHLAGAGDRETGGVANAFAGLIDHCLARQAQVVLTATLGPAQLTKLPARLTSRLAQGLVVGLEVLAPDSRLVFLQQRAQVRALKIDPEVLGWLAEHTPGSARQLEGALTRLEGLMRVHGQSLSLAQLIELFPEDAARKPTLERIVQQVGRYFQVEQRALCSRSRAHDALVPRQVGMYLARQLTDLSLEQIGAFFGGRDHSTVLHACRKIEQALTSNAALCGAVRQLHAALA